MAEAMNPLLNLVPQNSSSNTKYNVCTGYHEKHVAKQQVNIKVTIKWS